MKRAFILKRNGWWRKKLDTPWFTSKSMLSLPDNWLTTTLSIKWFQNIPCQVYLYRPPTGFASRLFRLYLVDQNLESDNLTAWPFSKYCLETLMLPLASPRYTSYMLAKAVVFQLVDDEDTNSTKTSRSNSRDSKSLLDWITDVGDGTSGAGRGGW